MSLINLTYCGADPPVRAGPPGPALRDQNTAAKRLARGPAADQGIRPAMTTDHPHGKLTGYSHSYRTLTVTLA